MLCRLARIEEKQLMIQTSLTYGDESMYIDKGVKTGSISGVNNTIHSRNGCTATSHTGACHDYASYF
jgi:hypothetical protein